MQFRKIKEKVIIIDFGSSINKIDSQKSKRIRCLFKVIAPQKLKN